MVKLKIHVFAYTCIFSLTTSQSRKLIFKADLKWECPYFYSKLFFWSISVSISKSKKMDFPCIFKKGFDRGRVSFSTKKNSEKAKLPKICLSFSGSMPEGKFKQCPLTPPSTECTSPWPLTHFSLTPDALLLVPWQTFPWPLTHFSLTWRAYFSELKKHKNCEGKMQNYFWKRYIS